MLTKIQGGRVIDPGKMDTIADILIKNDKIVEIIHLERHTSQVYLYIANQELSLTDNPTKEVMRVEELGSLRTALTVAFKYLGTPEFFEQQEQKYSAKFEQNGGTNS